MCATVKIKLEKVKRRKLKACLDYRVSLGYPWQLSETLSQNKNVEKNIERMGDVAQCQSECLPTMQEEAFLRNKRKETT